MKRFVIVTVGKTHSGKSTFARTLERTLGNALVIDQDNHAEFINTHYPSLLPKTGPNTFKYAVTNTIVDYAISQTNRHLILPSANRSQEARLALLAKFHGLGFTSVLVHFDLPEAVLAARVASTQRSTAIFRSAASFKEVLNRQQAEAVTAPSEDEAYYYFSVHDNDEVTRIVKQIATLVNA